ncbi:MAG: peptidase M48, partial [Pseudomonadota bacterium]
MITLTPILAAVGLGLAMLWFSALRLKSQLDAQSTELTDPLLTTYTRDMARALDLPRLDVYV